MTPGDWLHKAEIHLHTKALINRNIVQKRANKTDKPNDWSSGIFEIHHKEDPDVYQERRKGVKISKRNLIMKAKRNLKTQDFVNEEKIEWCVEGKSKGRQLRGRVGDSARERFELVHVQRASCTMFPMVNVRRAARGSCRGGPGLREGRSFRGGIIVPLSCRCPC